MIINTLVSQLSYTLKDGINDGFLTPFKVKRIKTTLDDYIYTDGDTVLEGEVEKGKLYKENDFNRTIVIEARERYRVKAFMDDANEKTRQSFSVQRKNMLRL